MRQAALAPGDVLPISTLSPAADCKYGPEYGAFSAAQLVNGPHQMAPHDAVVEHPGPVSFRIGPIVAREPLTITYRDKWLSDTTAGQDAGVRE